MDIEALKTEYEPRILSILNRIHDSLCSSGYQAGKPFDMHDEEYRWSLLVEGNDLPEPVHIDFGLREEAVSEGKGDGIAFDMNIVSYEGRILGGMCPYNYSKNLWVREPEAIEDRFWLFESADPSDVCDLIDSFKERQ